MDKKITKGEYKDALNLMSHLMLTKPETVRKFLANHGIKFSQTPTRKELINEMVNLLSTGNSRVYKDFASLISAHITHKGTEMAQFSKYFHSYQGEDDFFGAVTAGLGIAKKVSGLFRRKKKRRRSSTPPASQSAAMMKIQMDRQMATMRRQQQSAAAESRRRETEARRREDDRRREEQRRRQDAENSKGKNNNQVLMIGGAVAAVAVVGILLTQKKAA
ncbi:MAG: hypothetical protein ABJQ69_03600 [Ekhidna sp.]